MQEYGKSPASAHHAYTGIYVFALRATTNPAAWRIACRRSAAVGPAPGLDFVGRRKASATTLRVPPCRRSRKPPPRYTKTPPPEAARKQQGSLPRFPVVIPVDHMLRRAHAPKKLCFERWIRRSGPEGRTIVRASAPSNCQGDRPPQFRVAREAGVLVRRGGGVRVRRERRRRKSRCDAAHVARRSLRPRCGTAHQGCEATRLDAAGFRGRA